MSRLSRGQVVALVFIAVLFVLISITFDKIIDYKANKITYLEFDKTKTDILLNSNYLEYVNLGEQYIDKGLQTNQSYKTTYFLNETEVSNINTSDFGRYKIKYYLPNNETITKTVIVIDNKTPSISIPNKQTITSAQAASFDLKEGVIATDNSGKVELTFDNTLSTIPGDYVITYKAVDGSGNKIQRKRLIKVESGIEFSYKDNSLTITYPISKKQYTYKYSLDGGKTFIKTDRQTTITPSSSNIIAAVYENEKYIMANSFNITK